MTTMSGLALLAGIGAAAVILAGFLLLYAALWVSAREQGDEDLDSWRDQPEQETG